MKKVGSSKSKSKINRTLKSSQTLNDWSALSEAAQDMRQGVGYREGLTLKPADETLFKAFQSNLLSLVSHELKTPLMGILNSLTLLEHGEEESGLSQKELLAIARRNAHKLQQTLGSLLDLAALESGTFHPRLREIDLARVVKGRVDSLESLFKDRFLKLKLETPGVALTPPILADPQRLGRALELCLEVITQQSAPQSDVEIQVKGSEVKISFQLNKDKESEWKKSWSSALTGFQAGILSPASAFSTAVRTEEAFLSRLEEGLGNELLLAHQILKIHQGKLEQSLKKSGQVQVSLKLPQLSPVESLKAVMASRSALAATEISSVAFALLELPKGQSLLGFREQVKKGLFRASDAVYALPEEERLVLVMDDCKAEDVPRLIDRICRNLGLRLRYGLSSCPRDGFDPAKLFELATERLKEST